MPVPLPTGLQPSAIHGGRQGDLFGAPAVQSDDHMIIGRPAVLAASTRPEIIETTVLTTIVEAAPHRAVPFLLNLPSVTEAKARLQHGSDRFRRTRGLR